LVKGRVYLPEYSRRIGTLLEALTDNSLMLKVKNGDLDHLGLLFERYHKMLFAFFLRVHRNRELAEDLVQNVFVRILKYRSGFKGEGEFKVWMFFIARNVSNDHFKKEKKLGHSEDLTKWDDKVTDFRDNEEKEQKNIELKLLNQALEQLEPDKRQLIVMSKLEGIKYKDLAEMHQVTEGNIKIRVFRALKEWKGAYGTVQRNQDYEV